MASAPPHWTGMGCDGPSEVLGLCATAEPKRLSSGTQDRNVARKAHWPRSRQQSRLSGSFALPKANSVVTQSQPHFGQLRPHFVERGHAEIADRKQFVGRFGKQLADRDEAQIATGIFGPARTG